MWNTQTVRMVLLRNGEWYRSMGSWEKGGLLPLSYEPSDSLRGSIHLQSQTPCECMLEDAALGNVQLRIGVPVKILALKQIDSGRVVGHYSLVCLIP